ncbi:MAG: hypothetical protein BroJett018_03960 [Chloroflexota bacterium]|nr:hypothetical protein [Chloroflexota bacterium]NOG61809.1 hypothetical protein [Chloroflexota bacterium]GIK62602.1 MAG: hypothetical protein BroJett018_03960 [Chloroflexota bacterium]
MNIKTKPFTLNQMDYFKIALFHEFAIMNAGRRIKIALCLVMGLVILFTNPLASAALFFGIILTGVLILDFLPVWFKIMQHTIIMHQVWEVDGNHLSVSYQNGHVDQLDLANIQSIRKRFGFYFVSALKPEWLIPIPVNSFDSDSDAKQFKDILLSKKLMK